MEGLDSGCCCLSVALAFRARHSFWSFFPVRSWAINIGPLTSTKPSEVIFISALTKSAQSNEGWAAHWLIFTGIMYRHSGRVAGMVFGGISCGVEPPCILDSGWSRCPRKQLDQSPSRGDSTSFEKGVRHRKAPGITMYIQPQWSWTNMLGCHGCHGHHADRMQL